MDADGTLSSSMIADRDQTGDVMANLLKWAPKLTEEDHKTIEFAVRYFGCYHGDEGGFLLMKREDVIAALTEADSVYRNGTTAFHVTLKKLEELMRGRCPD